MSEESNKQEALDSLDGVETLLNSESSKELGIRLLNWAEFIKTIEEFPETLARYNELKGRTASKELKFASENQALQHLSDITGKKIKIASEYEIYHKSYTSATEEAYDYAKKNGYEIDDDSWHTEVTTGPGRPKNGQTTKHSIRLLKNGKENSKALHFQVFDMENDSYELNAYIS